MPWPSMSQPSTRSRHFLVALPLLVALGLPATACAAEDVGSVPQVDLGRYVGLWYEIASFPMFFQRKCVGDTTAEYAEKDAGTISVRNRCRTEDGFIEAEGRATVVPETGNGRLKVSFFWPFSSDYWIIGLDDEYRWALVGNPNRKYLWLLSRTPQLDAASVEKARDIAARQGFDLEKLRMTPHGPR
jgi:apolipoprotein D and lipocalin family protein